MPGSWGKSHTGRKTIKEKWVYSAKQNAYGQAIRCKTRLVEKGCSQVEGTDFTAVFSPVLKYVMIRLLIAAAAHYDLPPKRAHIKNALINADVTEKLYVQIPEGLVLRDSHHYAYHHNKAL